MSGFVGALTVELAILRGPEGWMLNGCPVSLAEAADTATIRRLAPAVDGQASVIVAWLDPDSFALDGLTQHYRRLTDRLYRYALPDDGYAAHLAVDDAGFVRAYPGFWEAAAPGPAPDRLAMSRPLG